MVGLGGQFRPLPGGLLCSLESPTRQRMLGCDHSYGFRSPRVVSTSLGVAPSRLLKRSVDDLTVTSSLDVAIGV